MPSTKTKTIYCYFVFILFYCVTGIVGQGKCIFLHFVNKTLNNKYSYEYFILQYCEIQRSEIVIKCFLQCKVFVIFFIFIIKMSLNIILFQILTCQFSVFFIYKKLTFHSAHYIKIFMQISNGQKKMFYKFDTFR